MDSNLTSQEQYAWCAGFFSGDGSIILKKDYKYNKIWGVTLCISQTDIRPLEKFKKIMGCGNINGPYKRESNEKFSRENSAEYWHYICCGIENNLKIIDNIWDYLYNFRKKQIQEKLKEYFNANSVRDFMPDFSTQKWFNYLNIETTDFTNLTENLLKSISAGFFDSEGSTWYQKHENRNTGRITLNVSQTILDPLIMFNVSINNLGDISGPIDRHNPKWKPFYMLNIYSIDKIKFTIEMLWRYLSEPKKEQYSKCLEQYESDQLNKETPGQYNKEKTHCSNGHPFEGDNLVIVGTRRRCRECKRIDCRTRAAKKREKLNSQQT